MRVLNASSYAADMQSSNNKMSLNFGKGPLILKQTFFDGADSFVKQVETMYRQSDSKDKIIIVSAINTKLSKLYTQLQQPFLERFRTIESIKNEIELYKNALNSFLLPV